MSKFKILLISIVLSYTTFLSASNIYDVSKYGAIGDGRTLNTVAIQKTIDLAAKNGGTVVLSKGIYLSGTLFLKSNITFRLEAGATLLGSPNISDYTKLTNGHNIDRQPYHLIVADQAENLTIEGMGIIDGNGKSFWKPYEKDQLGNMITPRWIMAKEQKVSPLIEITRCRNVLIKDIEIKTGGGWNLHLFNSDLVKVRGVNVVNDLFSPNSDGIDITGCNDVIISDCYIKTCDDAICLKTTIDSRECHRITVTNCIIETLCVGLKMGCNESNKDMTDVTFSNCIINKSSRAIGIYVKDGAVYDRITINNITANTNAPLIFNRPIQIMVNQLTENSKPGIIRNVIISNFICSTEGRIMLTCNDKGTIENVILKDIIINYPMIEDPTLYIKGSGSSQFPKAKEHPEAVGAKAAIIADNITNLQLENVCVYWPKDSIIPENWKLKERIENGIDRIHKPDYSKARQTEFGFFWGNRLKGGMLNNPMSSASTSILPKYDIKNSTIQIVK